jgi:hypothetical protein
MFFVVFVVAGCIVYMLVVVVSFIVVFLYCVVLCLCVMCVTCLLYCSTTANALKHNCSLTYIYIYTLDNSLEPSAVQLH